MQDRVPANPGRVKITPESGSAYYATIERADNPTQVGTPLNKANLLTDATAADILEAAGITPGTPNEAFDALANMLHTLDTTKVRIETGSYVGTGTYGSANPCSLTFDFVPTLVWCGARQYALGNYAYSPETGLYPHLGMINTNMLSTEYTGGFTTAALGFGYGDNSSTYTLYAKKSGDGKTISWYTYSTSSSMTAARQNNTSGTTYYYIAIG